MLGAVSILLGLISAIMCCKAGVRCMGKRMALPGPHPMPVHQKRCFLHPASIWDNLKISAQQKEIVLCLQKVDELLISHPRHRFFLEEGYPELMESLSTNLNLKPIFLIPGDKPADKWRQSKSDPKKEGDESNLRKNTKEKENLPMEVNLEEEKNNKSTPTGITNPTCIVQVHSESATFANE